MGYLLKACYIIATSVSVSYASCGGSHYFYCWLEIYLYKWIEWTKKEISRFISLVLFSWLFETPYAFVKGQTPSIVFFMCYVKNSHI